MGVRNCVSVYSSSLNRYGFNCGYIFVRCRRRSPTMSSGARPCTQQLAQACRQFKNVREERACPRCINSDAANTTNLHLTIISPHSYRHRPTKAPHEQASPKSSPFVTLLKHLSAWVRDKRAMMHECIPNAYEDEVQKQTHTHTHRACLRPPGSRTPDKLSSVLQPLGACSQCRSS